MSFKLKTELNCSAARAYAAWLSEKDHKAMVADHPDCKFDVKVGGKWQVGSLEGVFKELGEDNFKIVMDWRYVEGWDGPYSNLTLEFKDIEEGRCELHLSHENLPKDLEEEVKEGWKDYYFDSMDEYFEEMAN